MNEDQLSFIRDMCKTEGWKIICEMNDKAVKDYRFLATEQKIPLEDRLWYSALAKGREELIEDVKQKINGS